MFLHVCPADECVDCFLVTASVELGQAVLAICADYLNCTYE